MILDHVRQNAVAYLALAVALSTGTAYAADQIADGSVTSSKLAKDAVTSAKIKKGAVKSSDLKDGQVSGADVKDGSLSSSDLASGSVDSRVVADGSVAVADLAPGVLPSGAWARTAIPNGPNPSATPDNVLSEATLSLPRAGKVYIRGFIARYGVDCPGGLGVVALYLDGVAIPGSGVNASTVSFSYALESVGVVDASAGSHIVTLRNDCLNGAQTNSVISGLGATFTALSAGD